MKESDRRTGQAMPYALQVRFTGEQQAWLAARAESENRSVGSVVRELIDDAIAEHHGKAYKLRNELRAAVANEEYELAAHISEELHALRADDQD